MVDFATITTGVLVAVVESGNGSDCSVGCNGCIVTQANLVPNGKGK